MDGNGKGPATPRRFEFPDALPDREERTCPRCGHTRFTAAITETIERVTLLEHHDDGYALVRDEEFPIGRRVRLACVRCSANYLAYPSK